MITADHEVLSEEQESRLHHRYAVVLQDLATQWIQSYPCKTKSAQETQRSLRKFLRLEEKPRTTYTDYSLECIKSLRDYFIWTWQSTLDFKKAGGRKLWSVTLSHAHFVSVELSDAHVTHCAQLLRFKAD